MTTTWVSAWGAKLTEVGEGKLLTSIHERSPDSGNAMVGNILVKSSDSSHSFRRVSQDLTAASQYIPSL